MKLLALIIAFLFTVNIYAQEVSTQVYKYYPNGNKKELNCFYNGKLHGECYVWDTSGVVIAKAYYFNGKKHGQWKIWHDNGQLAYVLEYCNGEKVGQWKSYDKEGKLIGSKKY